MKRLMIILCMYSLPVTLLTAQQNFEGRIHYIIKEFASTDANTPDSFSMWFSGSKLKILASMKTEAGSAAHALLLFHFDSGKAYIQAMPQQKIMVIPIALLNTGQAAQNRQQPRFTGDSATFFGSTCYKYLLDANTSLAGGKPSTTPSTGWYSASHVFTPGSTLSAFPFFNQKGEILLKSESFSSPGVYNSLAVATAIIPGRPDAHVFDIDESQVDSTLGSLLSTMSDTGRAPIKMPEDDVLTGEAQKNLEAAKKEIEALNRRHDMKKRGAYAPINRKKIPVKKKGE